jgi:site-specific DNA-methyltransferase (adenine-specific)/modification methylase
MVETVTIGDATLYLGDAREIVPTLDASLAVISDPPYGIGYAHAGGERRFSKVGQTAASKIRGVPKIRGDDAPFDPSPMLRFDNVLLWGADHYKLAGMPTWDSFSDVEFGWHSQAAASRIFSLKWKGLACAKVGENNGRRDHPTQKPIALMRWCIDQAGNPPDVLDHTWAAARPALRAPSSAAASSASRSSGAGFDIACRRIEAAQAAQAA